MSNVRKFKRRSRFHALKVFIIFGVLIAAAYILLFSMFRINHIVIEGSERYTEDEIREFLIKDKLDHNSVLLFLKCKYKEKPSIPFIQKMNLELVDKNTVKVTLYDKVIAGCVEYMGSYMYFDKDGIVEETSAKHEEGIPEVVGLKFTRIAMNEEIMIQKQSLFRVILDITKLIRQYELDVQKIAFNSDNEVTLYCGNSIALLGHGKDNYYDKQISNLGNMIKAAKGKAYQYDLRNYGGPEEDVIAIPNKNK